VIWLVYLGLPLLLLVVLAYIVLRLMGFCILAEVRDGEQDVW